MSLNNPNHLHPLTTLWSNKSHTSVATASDAATFHSAQGHAHTSSTTSHMELQQIDLTSPPPHSNPPNPQQKPPTSPKIESIRMDRQDSGYSDSTPTLTATNTHSQASSRRTSSSSTRQGKSSPSTRSKTTRPGTKRAARSTPNTYTYTQGRNSTSSRRPSMQTRHTASLGYATIHPPAYPATSLHNNAPHQFFQFPLLAPDTDGLGGEEGERDGEGEGERPPPPPATVQYWTSDSTRRLEYAAIDAAGRGVRGFFIRLVPDCMLPPGSRRTRFCERNEDADSDAGSVRRYRLVLPEEKEVVQRARSGSADGLGSKRPGAGGGGGGLLRRWTTGLGFGKRI